MANKSFEAIFSLYRTRIAKDRFTCAATPEDFPGWDSIKNFIRDVAARNIHIQGPDNELSLPDITDLNIKFSDFAKMKVTGLAGNVGQIEHLVTDFFCIRQIPQLIHDVARARENSEISASLWADFDVTSWGEWQRACLNEVMHKDMIVALKKYLISAIGDRSLLSFFISAPEAGKFAKWGAGIVGGLGRPLKPTRVEHDKHTVTVNFSRYNMMEDVAVTGYEWSAVAEDRSTAVVDAGACGMVYIFNRVDGLPTCPAQEMLIVADSVADTDVLQVKAFMDQHPSYRQIIVESDIAFVWVWDKRVGSAQGLGALCLQDALAILRKRFKRVNVVVFDTRPAQFNDWHAVDPPMVAVEKQQAIEKLTSYIQTLDFPKCSVLHIFQRSGNPMAEAIQALGEAYRALENGGNG